MILEVHNLQAFYGKSHVIHNISFNVQKGEVIGILGRNGVGKTTLLRSILGLFPPRRKGTIIFDNKNISSLSTNEIVRMGIGYVPQGRRIFPKLTVLENLSTRVVTGKIKESNIEMVFSYFPVLREKIGQLGGTLSGGEQQMLAIGRAIITTPKLIIIDEPTAGLQPSMVNIVRKSIKNLCKMGITAIIADQNLENTIELCSKVYVLEKGEIKYSGKKENLSIETLYQYLGVTRKGNTKIKNM